jgi:hypothetical protein
MRKLPNNKEKQYSKFEEFVKSQKSPSPLMGEGRGEGE